ncbi:MAG: response regulator [Bacteroidota bacterium]|nr:response regulator [Bacteroidota bacterium]
MSLKRKIRVFYIEDSEICSLMIDHKLRDLADFNIYSFTSAEAAFKDLYFQPDVVVLDYNLPGMNGLQATRKFKQLYPELPIIILSGQNNIDVTIDLMRAGACEYMSKKNFSIIELHEKICRVNEKKQFEMAQNRFKINKSLLVLFLVLIIAGIIWYKF